MQQFQMNHKTPIGHNISESDIQTWMAKNCFECKGIGGKITKKDCKAFREMAYHRPIGHPGRKCLDCSKMKKDKKPKPRMKVCQLHTDYPGYCLGSGKFFEKPGAKPHEFKHKLYCTGECGHRHNYFKNARGYKTSADIIGRVTKSYRPEMVG